MKSERVNIDCIVTKNVESVRWKRSVRLGTYFREMSGFQEGRMWAMWNIQDKIRWLLSDKGERISLINTGKN